MSMRGFHYSVNDYSLYLKISRNIFTSLAVCYILITGNNIEEICEIECFVNFQFKIKYFGEDDYFLRMEFVRENSRFIITQRKFSLELFTEFHCLECQDMSAPLNPT